MLKFLISYLTITGIGAFIAIAMPGLVVLGFFLLIIPGLVLSLMPSAFMYGVIFAAGWYAAQTVFGDGFMAIIAGIAAVAIVTTLATMPTRLTDMAMYQASILPDATPPSRIALKGHVRFDLLRPDMNQSQGPGYAYVPGQAGYSCNSYCLAALFTPGVTSVTIDKAATDGNSALSLEARTYRLARRPACESNALVDFNSIAAPLSSEGRGGISQYEDGKLLVSKWAMKLAGDYCLLMEPARPDPDFTIVERETDNGAHPDRWEFGPGRLETQTVEIFAGKHIVYRSHQSSITTLGWFLSIMGTGGIENFGFGLGRSTTHSKVGYDAVKLSRSLGEYTNLAGKPEPDSAKQKVHLLPELRMQIAAALDNPALDANSPAFQIIQTYLEAVGSKASNEDVALISRLVSDQRLTRYPGSWALKLPLEQTRQIYDAYTRRLIATGAPAEMAKSLAGMVGNLGPDAVKLIGPEQQKLLDDPVKRLAVPELVKALGYGKPDNGRVLFAILKQHAAVLAEIRRQRETQEIGGYDRQSERDSNISLVGAAESGLCLLGPQASGIRQELEQFLASGTMLNHLVTGHAMTDWNVILVRMGKPVSSVEKPANMSGTVSNYQRNVQAKIDHWQPDRC